MTHSPRASRALPILLLLASCAGSYRLERRPTSDHVATDVMQLRWQRTLAEPTFLDYKPQQWATAAIDAERGVVFVGSTAGQFEAIRARDGRRMWSVAVGGGVSSAALHHQQTQTVFFGADTGQMIAVDSVSGKERWRYNTQGTINRSPAYCEGVLLFTSSEGRIYALDAETGKWRWQYDREAPEGFTIHGYAGVAVRGTTVYTGFPDGYLVALRAFSGDVIWARSLKGDADKFVDVDATPIFDGDRLLTASYASGIFALSPDTGSILWHQKVEGASELAAHRGMIYYTAPRVGLVALDTSGRQMWRQAIAKGVPSRPVAFGPYVLVSGTETGLYVASASSGRLLQRFDLGWGISAPPAVASRLVVVLSNGGKLSAFSVN